MAYLPVHSALFRSVVCSIQVLHVLFALHLGIACFYVLLKWFFFSFNCSLPMHKHIRFFILILYPVILLNSLILVYLGGGQTLEFSTLIVMLSVKRVLFFPFCSLCLVSVCGLSCYFTQNILFLEKYFNKIKPLPNGLSE